MKKLLAVLLAVCLFCGAMGVTVYAATGVEALNQGQIRVVQKELKDGYLGPIIVLQYENNLTGCKN